jgi:hypothetical protein
MKRDTEPVFSPRSSGAALPAMTSALRPSTFLASMADSVASTYFISVASGPAEEALHTK